MVNPLLNSCECDGSVRYVHYECLKHWLNQKMEKIEKETEKCKVISYHWKSFECELCKHAYPYVFKARGHNYRLADIIDSDLP
jgi:E3 ubiquitin-protein ligase DOA10